MSKKLISIEKYDLDIFPTHEVGCSRVVFTFANLREENYTKIFTESEILNLEFKYYVSKQELIKIFQEAIVLLKDSLL